MFELRRVSLHNWYLFEGEDLEVRGAIALLGQTGSGKSAILDAVQTVVTGCNRSALRLNASAGEARDRTVASYCLGEVSDVEGGEPRRESSETVVAVTFTNGANQNVSIGLLLSVDRAELSADPVRARFLIRGHGFALADFVETDTEGNQFVPGHEELQSRMKARFGKAITFHARSTPFVAEFLTAMRPRHSPDPERFLRTFAAALSAREIKDPTDFVRRFVLDQRNLDIQGVRQSIKVWTELQEEVKKLEKMLAAGKSARARYTNWATHRIGADTQTFIASFADRLLIERSIQTDETQRAAFDERRTRRTSEIGDIEAGIVRLEQLNRRDIGLAATTDEARKRQALEADLRSVRTEVSVLARPLQDALAPYLWVTQMARLEAHLPAYARAAVAAAAELASRTSGRPPLDWAMEGTDVRLLAERVRKVLQADGSLRQQLAATISDLTTLQGELAALDGQLRAAGDGGPLLSRETIEFRGELTRRGIPAVALPDVVDVSEPEWAFALEALLGAHREALIVPVAQVDEAFDVLYHNRQRFDVCRLVNTRKTKAGRARLTEKSIAEVAVTNDVDARSFIDSRVGRFTRADSQQEFEQSDTAILRNGKTSSGQSLRVFRDRRPILGRTAQAAAIEEARRRRAEVQESIEGPSGLEQRRRLLEGGLRCLEALALAAEPDRIETDARALEDARVRALGLQRDIHELSSSDSTGLLAAIADREERIVGMKDDIAALRKDVAVDSEQIVKLKVRIQQATHRAAQLKQMEAMLAARQLAERERQTIEAAGITDTILVVRERVLNQLGIAWSGREEKELRGLKAAAEAESQRHNEQLREAQRRAEREFYDFISDYVGQNPLPPEADEADKLFWLDGRVRRLEEHELMPHRDRVAKAREEVEVMLKEDLLTKLNERLEYGRVQLDSLNRRLVGRTFVGQTYAFSRRINERLKPLADLAKRVGLTFDGSYATLSQAKDAEFAEALRRVEEIVVSQDDTKEIEDYRNYHVYDLQIRSADGRVSDLSKIAGKLSGGQRQAPYYVAIAASMLSMYFPGGRTGDSDGLGLILFDEAFNQLDVRNTQALLHLFQGLGLQVVIAAPEAHRPTFLECMDTIVSVVRQPSTEDVLLRPTFPGPAARAAMRQENPEHLGVEGFRERIKSAEQHKAAE
ncbi:SbcC/MukB-like Walker B domain-containing protein [Falsiroseomonas sp. HW251]|uniref:SbcC/MukB-like Walker B domain-containing protein n=1 Tax=Falsiroseomonas sp. HW251 TaxID=3390998 RepID=UPI003D318B64